MQAAAIAAPRRRSPLQQPFAWPKALLALLGKVPDGVLARLADVTRETVFYERHRRGIEATQTHVHREWTIEAIALLGTASDAAVGAALGFPPHAAWRQRQLLGIPPFNPPPYARAPSFDWGPEEVALLGKMSDQAVARALHLSANAVGRQRRSLQIPAFRPQSPAIAWSAEMLERLGKAPDPEVARRFGIPLKAVKGKRRQLGIPSPVDWGAIVPTARLRRLLAAPTTEVRRQTGLGWHTIVELRRRLGIEARRLSRPWTAAEIALLGTAPDEEIAARLGRTVYGVREKRWRLHIRQHLRKAAAATAVNPRPFSASEEKSERTGSPSRSRTA